MLRKIRRKLAHRSIKKFLLEFMPKVGLGNVYLFECENFNQGDYAVHTNQGKYKLTFWELVNSAEEFTLELSYNGGEGEFITFSIHGNVFFTIMPETHTIDREGERQVVDLVTGKAKVYPKVADAEKLKYKMIEYKEPIIQSSFICYDTILKATYDYIF